MAGWLEGVRYYQDPANKDDVISIVAERTKVPAATISKLYGTDQWPYMDPNGRVDTATVAAEDGKWLLDNKIIEKLPEVGDWHDGSVVDAALRDRRRGAGEPRLRWRTEAGVLTYPRPSRLAEVLRDGGVALGSLTLLQEPAIGEILGALGYDFVVPSTPRPTSRACWRWSGRPAWRRATPLVRLRRIEEKDLLWLLDSGAGELVLPLVETGAQAVEAARLTHYPPVGDRTLCSAARAAGHGTARGRLRPLPDLGRGRTPQSSRWSRPPRWPIWTTSSPPTSTC